MRTSCLETLYRSNRFQAAVASGFVCQVPDVVGARRCTPQRHSKPISRCRWLTSPDPSARDVLRRQPPVPVMQQSPVTNGRAG
jgi:hypothetical protein